MNIDNYNELLKVFNCVDAFICVGGDKTHWVLYMRDEFVLFALLTGSQGWNGVL